MVSHWKEIMKLVWNAKWMYLHVLSHLLQMLKTLLPTSTNTFNIKPVPTHSGSNSVSVSIWMCYVLETGRERKNLQQMGWNMILHCHEPFHQVYSFSVIIIHFHCLNVCTENCLFAPSQPIINYMPPLSVITVITAKTVRSLSYYWITSCSLFPEETNKNKHVLPHFLLLLLLFELSHFCVWYFHPSRFTLPFQFPLHSPP